MDKVSKNNLEIPAKYLPTLDTIIPPKNAVIAENLERHEIIQRLKDFIADPYSQEYPDFHKDNILYDEIRSLYLNTLLFLVVVLIAFFHVVVDVSNGFD